MDRISGVCGFVTNLSRLGGVKQAVVYFAHRMRCRQDMDVGGGGSSAQQGSSGQRSWGLMDPLSGRAAHTAGRLLLIAGRQLSLFLLYGLLHRLRELPPSMVAGFQERESQGSRVNTPDVFAIYSEVTQHHCHNTLLV